MTIYAYTGRDQTGRELKGVLEADDERTVRATLRRRGVLVTKTRAESAKNHARLKVPAEELARMTSQLASMLEAGLPLSRCLKILEGDSENNTMRRLVRMIGVDVEGGAALSVALARYPQVFSEFYVGLVLAGERSGFLSRTLNRVATQLKADVELQRAVQRAFAYPAIVLSIGLVVVIFLVARVVPVFENVYRQLGSSLPGPTLALLFLSHFVRTYGVAILVASPFATFAMVRFWRSSPGQRLVDRVRLRLPLVGPVLRMIVVNRFVSTLGTLLGSGVTTLEAFGVAERVAGSYSLSQVIDDVREHVRRGEGISPAMGRSSLIPAQVTSMVAVGEETGSLPEMLDRASRTLDSEIDHRLKKLLARLEPLLTSILALLVGFVVMGLYLPMFDLLGKVGR